MSPLPFSKRNRYAGTPKEITIREDAPETLRYFVLEIVIDLGWGPSSLRDALCPSFILLQIQVIGASTPTSGERCKR
jgi:hypothetical protein